MSRAPADIAYSSSVSAAPWVWRGLTELVVFSRSRQPIPLIRRAFGEGTFSDSSVVSTITQAGRALSFDGTNFWSQNSYLPEKTGHEVSTITAVIQPANSSFGVFYGTVSSVDDWIFTLAANGDESNTVAGALGVQVRDNSGAMDRGYTPDAGIDDGRPHIATFRIDALNEVYDVFVDGAQYGITKTANGALTTSSGSVEYPYYFGARNLRGSADQYYNGAMSLFMRHGGQLWTDAQIGALHADWFGVIRRRSLLVPVSSGGADITGSGSPQAQDATATGSGTRIITGSTSVQAQAATATGTGERIIVEKSSSVQAQDATASGSGTIGAEITGSGSAQAQDATVTATGERVITASGSPQAQDATATGTGERIITGSAAVQAQDANASGTETQEAFRSKLQPGVAYSRFYSYIKG